MKGGYMGKILFVNLTDETIRTEPVDPQVAEKYIGGKGYSLYLFYYRYLKEYMKKGISPRDIDPLGPENVLVFGTGPLTGVAGVPSPGRHYVMTLRSPLTGSVGSANSGGEFGAYMKFAGYDMIVVEGASEKPVYLEVVNGHVEIKNASDLWGKNVFDTTRVLKNRVKAKNVSAACIGPAGENLVLFANIMNDEHRAAGRTGVGAVMGSKKLKAIVVAGDEKPQIAKPDEYRELSKNLIERIKKNPVTGEGLPKYGTAILINIINQAGMLPYKNWQFGYNPEADKISGETLEKTYLIGRRACWGCQISCGRVTKVPSGPYQILYSEGPEYESTWALGNSTGVMDLAAIVKANHLCDELGIDTISMGSTIAAAMELYEKGYIPEEDLQGLDLRFGNAAALVEAVWRTAYKVGFGAKLALGSKRLAELYGAPELSMSVKGLEMPAYDPRGAKGIGLNYATANRGGCHVTGYTISPEILGIPQKIDPLTPEGKAQWVKTFQDFTSVVNSAVNCLFVTFEIGVKDYADLFNTVAGFNFTADDLMKIGERIYNLERYIMSLYGFSAKDDTLPRRLTHEPMPEGPAKGQVVELDRMLKEYYQLRGWVDGVPTKEKLKELGIEI
ncbi:aldehyde ferredoxin oxidoreductase family protein [Infirmifilum lucidum]|uniref:Aldehyde ferredoxin oxidoreductase family protein n=1 Tax=Infirmifilum lucidum TaxID=2776706 RepID=A0A7L9FI56_9CREN|nr:aldehyde ferredoxin oxidoreductase family protein [Infirmifilum lucidum]